MQCYENNCSRTSVWEHHGEHTAMEAVKIIVMAGLGDKQGVAGWRRVRRVAGRKAFCNATKILPTTASHCIMKVKYSKEFLLLLLICFCKSVHKKLWLFYENHLKIFRFKGKEFKTALEIVSIQYSLLPNSLVDVHITIIIVLQCTDAFLFLILKKPRHLANISLKKTVQEVKKCTN